MSRSNNTGANNAGRGGYAPAPQQPQQPYQPAPQPAGQWRHPLDIEDPQTAPPPPHWAQPHAQHPQADPYAQPHNAPYQPPGQAAYAQQSAQLHGFEQPGYANQHDYPPQQQDAYGRGGLASYSPQHAHELSAFAQPPQWPPPPADPRGGYDLGEYAPGTLPPALHGHPPAEPAFTHDPYARATARTQPPAGWPAQPQSGYPQEPSFGTASGYGQAAPQGGPLAHPGYPSSHVQSPLSAPDQFRGTQAGAPDLLAPAAQYHGQQAHDGDDSEEMEFEEEEEAPRRGRTLLIVGALVGAIFVGGGLAYTYRALTGGGKTPMLAADKSAVKTKADAGSQRPPQQVPKLPDVAPKTQVASEGDATGPRRVATIPVGPDGNPQPMPSPMAQPQTLSMPGLAVTMPPPMPMPQRDAQPSPPTPQQQVRPQPTPPPVTQAPAAPAQPKVITPPPAQRQAALPEGQPAPPPKKVVKPKENDAYTAPGSGSGTAGTTASAPTTKSALGAGGNGFVAAILSTPKGKVEAMKAFADLQQKFPDVLSGKPAEVQEVNLGETKGVWYRAVVGPPGSRSAAAAVCEQLKAAGYTQCFATAY